MQSAAAIDLEKDASARLGITLRSKWHLDTLLGIGGMAAVYAATHRNGMRGAVKILHRSASDPEMRHRFLREGRIANHVAHEGVVSVVDDDVSEDGSPFLVMELLDGEAFSALAAKAGHRLPSELVLRLIDQVLDALAAAHHKGIVHRDIKPENLFVTTDGRVKVLDFGIAHLEEPLETQMCATQLGLTMGTPAFMSPEQARGRWDLVGPASDLWSLGATMFTLLTGKLVHEGDSLLEVLAATITQPPPSLAVALPGAPTQVVAIVDRALQLKLVNRWSDAQDMQEAVRAAYRAITGEDIPRTVTPLPAARSSHAMQLPASRPSPSTQLPTVAVRRARPRSSLVLGAVASAALVMATFVTFRSSSSASAAGARSFDLPVFVPAPQAVVATTTATTAPPAATTAPPATTTAPPVVVVRRTAAAATPIVAAAVPSPERKPDRMFDRRH